MLDTLPRDVPQKHVRNSFAVSNDLIETGRPSARRAEDALRLSLHRRHEHAPMSNSAKGIKEDIHQVLGSFLSVLEAVDLPDANTPT